MPLLPWRTDADGFCFSNSWQMDSTEHAALAAIAGTAAPAAVAAVFTTAVASALAINPALIFDPTLPTLFSALTVASSGIAAAATSGAQIGFGMCGGMAYTSLDYWLAKAELPRGGNRSDQPMRPVQATLRDTIWQRLLDSLTGGGALQTTILWSLVLNQLPPLFGGGGGTLLNWTKAEWIKIKAMIDSGKPQPIGLIYATRDVWDQHQILVYGYDLLPNGARLYVYDNNNPHNPGDPALNPNNDFLTFDLTGSVLSATSPGDSLGGTLAGFFCTNYTPVAPPSGLAPSFGRFVAWGNGLPVFMEAYGAILQVANATELTALGGTLLDPRQAAGQLPPGLPHPRDYALLREHSAAPVFLYQGGAPFWVPDPTQLMKFGGWDAVRVVPDNTLGQFSAPPLNGTLIREISDTGVFMCNTNGSLSPSMVPAASPDVRAVPDGAISSRLLDKVMLDYSAVLLGTSVAGRVSLKAPFVGADLPISITVDQPSFAKVTPGTVTIPKGSLTSADFTVSFIGSAPPPNFTVTVSATVSGKTVSTTLQYNPPSIATFTFSPSTVTAGQSSTGTIVLTSQCPVDLTVNLLSYSGFVTIPITAVPIPKNTLQITFTINTPASGAPFAILTVQPSVVAGTVLSLTLFPSSVQPGGHSTGTVTLEAAVSTPTVVGLASFPLGGSVFGGSSPLIASMPSQITIAPQQTSGSFQITTKVISAQVTQRTAVIMAVAVTQVYAHLVITT
jgi:hypothetical protein